MACEHLLNSMHVVYKQQTSKKTRRFQTQLVADGDSRSDWGVDFDEVETICNYRVDKGQNLWVGELNSPS
jgi:hypothetical protein